MGTDLSFVLQKYTWTVGLDDWMNLSEKLDPQLTFLGQFFVVFCSQFCGLLSEEFHLAYT